MKSHLDLGISPLSDIGLGLRGADLEHVHSRLRPELIL
jgi:hypothetical protein